MRLFSSLLLSSCITLLLFMLMGNLVSANSSSVVTPTPFNFEEPPKFDPLALKPRHPPKKIEKPEQPEPVTQPKNVNKPTKVKAPAPLALFKGDASTNFNDDFQSPLLTQGDFGMSQSFGPKVMVEPSYPPEAAMKGLEGEVTLEFDVNHLGQVENIRIIAAKPKRIFSEAAIRALSRWTFTPEHIDGKAVARKGERITLTFQLDGA